MWFPILQAHNNRNFVEVKAFTFWAALVSHYCFVLGMVLFGFGALCAGLALGLPPALAACAGAQAPLLQLARVVVVGPSRFRGALFTHLECGHRPSQDPQLRRSDPSAFVIRE